MSPDVVRCGPARRSAAVIMAGRGLAWPRTRGRWLPVWLPGITLATLMFESQGAAPTCLPGNLTKRE